MTSVPSLVLLRHADCIERCPAFECIPVNFVGLNSSEFNPTRHRPASFDDLVGELLELRWHIEAECRGTFEVDHEIKPLRTLYR